MTDDEKINEVLEEFDFDEVHKVMVFLNWSWVNDDETFTVPNCYRMIQDAKKLLYDCKKSKNKYFTTATGGFVARKGKSEDGDNFYSLSFVLCECSNI